MLIASTNSILHLICYSVLGHNGLQNCNSNIWGFRNLISVTQNWYTLTNMHAMFHYIFVKAKFTRNQLFNHEEHILKATIHQEKMAMYKIKKKFNT